MFPTKQALFKVLVVVNVLNPDINVLLFKYCGVYVES